MCDHCNKLCWCNPCFYFTRAKECPVCHHIVALHKLKVKIRVPN